MVRPKSNSHLGCNNNGHTTLTHWVAPSKIGSDPPSSQEDNVTAKRKRRLYRDHFSLLEIDKYKSKSIK